MLEECAKQGLLAEQAISACEEKAENGVGAIVNVATR